MEQVQDNSAFEIVHDGETVRTTDSRFEAVRLAKRISDEGTVVRVRRADGVVSMEFRGEPSTQSNNYHGASHKAHLRVIEWRECVSGWEEPIEQAPFKQHFPF